MTSPARSPAPWARSIGSTADSITPSGWLQIVTPRWPSAGILMTSDSTVSASLAAAAISFSASDSSGLGTLLLPLRPFFAGVVLLGDFGLICVGGA